MVFMPGPRQCGKTTLAKMLASDFPNHLYFNWDIPTDRVALLRDPFFFQELPRRDESRPLVILDEIHKFGDWKNYLKGVYDRFADDFVFLVTGSGRLDMYQRGGDSLAGRYHQFQLWPLTLAELAGHQRSPDEFLAAPLGTTDDRLGEAGQIWERLSRLSGFPEPYLSGKVTSYRRWSRSYHRRLVREDIRDLTEVRSIQAIETLFYLLPERVGSPLSIQNLAGDLRKAYNSVADWLATFERFYLTFSLPPWTRRVSRAIQKARKTYLLDYALVEDAGARFENMVALELLRTVTTMNALGAGDFSLHFVRDREKREVDFLIADRHHPVLLVEAKLSEEPPAPALLRFQQQLGVPAVQVHQSGEAFRRTSRDGLELLVTPVTRWLPLLP